MLLVPPADGHALRSAHFASIAWFGVAKPGVPPPVTASDKRAAPPPPAEPEEAVAAAPAAPASAPAPVVAKRAAPAPPAEEVPVIAKRAAPATPTEEVPNYENEEHTTKPWFFGVMSRAEAEVRQLRHHSDPLFHTYLGTCYPAGAQSSRLWSPPYLSRP